MRLICTHPIISPRLDPDRDPDRRVLEALFELDLKLVKERELRPTEMFAVLRRK